VRNVSLTLRQALYGQESGEVAVVFVTITHEALATPLRLVNVNVQRLSTDPLIYGAVSRGDQYLFVNMDVSLPDEKDQSPPRGRLVLSNVGREAVALARSVTSPPAVKIELALASALNDVEIEWPQMDMVGADFGADTITFELAMDSFSTESCPTHSFDPSFFPGLFQDVIAS
jgi:hypothetical protein